MSDLNTSFALVTLCQHTFRRQTTEGLEGVSRKNLKIKRCKLVKSRVFLQHYSPLCSIPVPFRTRSKKELQFAIFQSRGSIHFRRVPHFMTSISESFERVGRVSSLSSVSSVSSLSSLSSEVGWQFPSLFYVFTRSHHQHWHNIVRCAYSLHLLYAKSVVWAVSSAVM
jgi:hypothetical protein